MNGQVNHRLKARRLGIDTQSEPILFLHRDRPVCRSEGFTSLNRVALVSGGKSIIATLYQVKTGILTWDEAGLSDVGWARLGLREGDMVSVRHPRRLNPWLACGAGFSGMPSIGKPFGRSFATSSMAATRLLRSLLLSRSAPQLLYR
jgi:hypothetical protein